ncbi:hypothetical protein Naga_101289g1 [Nannochloropsis gaditana]|uniref:Uncharacterized protein n=1 Tax=Nannochloropsis gaditana TaxID=72520 RepID=W7TQ23_9STRA|nr:hypothetical protein Naga_101289g1 [Nannochloropsis gaditana]
MLSASIYRTKSLRTGVSQSNALRAAYFHQRATLSVLGESQHHKASIGTKPTSIHNRGLIDAEKCQRVPMCGERGLPAPPSPPIRLSPPGQTQDAMGTVPSTKVEGHGTGSTERIEKDVPRRRRSLGAKATSPSMSPSRALPPKSPW